MPVYNVTQHFAVDADTPEAAAVEAARLLQLPTRRNEFAVTGPRALTVFVRVERGEAKRIA